LLITSLKLKLIKRQLISAACAQINVNSFIIFSWAAKKQDGTRASERRRRNYKHVKLRIKRAPSNAFSILRNSHESTSAHRLLLLAFAEWKQTSQTAPKGFKFKTAQLQHEEVSLVVARQHELKHQQAGGIPRSPDVLAE
jgi:hypothetical protein